MAKYELALQTDFDEFVEEIKEGVVQRSRTISLEEETELTAGDARIHVAAYERYAYTGQNRSSLNLTFVGHDGIVRLIGIATGGSQAMFFKVNTWSERAFLETLEYAANDYMRDHDLKPLDEYDEDDENEYEGE
ncbi:MAG: hypothetical protein II882_07645 [Lachnospiraceae bacterium]|nr:hypothetical protein [Lachnospiraceae bacterium]